MPKMTAAAVALLHAAETPEQVAERFGLPVEWAKAHVGHHRCVDGRTYVSSCLVTDPVMDWVGRGKLRRQGVEISEDRAWLLGVTRDETGNAQRWRLAARAEFCDDAMAARMLIKRHVAVFEVDAAAVEVVHTEWTRP